MFSLKKQNRYNVKFSCFDEVYIIKILGIKINILKRHCSFKYVKYKLLKFIFRKKALGIYLNPYIRKVLNILRDESPIKNEFISSNYVWSMWWQEEVPEMIQMCLDTIRRYHPNLIIITEKNYKQYIDIPIHIMDKFNKGIIPPPHFSDYIRILLLYKYGGTWIDASCYMLMSVPKFILKQPFFILKNQDFSGFSNYFIHSEPENYLVKAIKLCLEEYWLHENVVIHYFFFHGILKGLIEQSETCKNIFNSVLPELNIKTKMITKLSSLTNYSDDVWDYLRQTCFMYKLARKSSDFENPNGFIQHLINEYNTEKEKMV